MLAQLDRDLVTMDAPIHYRVALPSDMFICTPPPPQTLPEELGVTAAAEQPAALRPSADTVQPETEYMYLPEAEPAPVPLAPVNWVSLGMRIARWAAKISAFTFAAGLFLVVAVATLPVFWGNRTLVIESGSMEPTIHVGSAAITEPVPSASLQVGDVIAFSPDANASIPIVHRIANIEDRKGTTYYTTRGDANDSTDAEEFTLPPTAWRVQRAVPLVGYIIMFASSPTGIGLFIVIPTVCLVILSLWDGLNKIRRVLQPARQTVCS